MRPLLIIVILAVLVGVLLLGKFVGIPPFGTHIPTVDRSCNIDADCVSKNVGKCCGASYSCVNKDAETYPHLVSKRCSEQGIMSTCDVNLPPSCVCVNTVCQGVQVTIERLE